MGHQQRRASRRSCLPGRDNYFHAFLYEAGVLTDLGTIGPGCNPGHSWAFDINDAGQIAGLTCASGIYPRAFLRSGGVMADLGTLGGTGSSARSINNAGDIVGVAALPGDPFAHAFVYHGGAMQDLGTLGGAWSEALHINDHGRIVGHSEINPLPDRQPHAFLYNAPTMIDLFPGGPCCSVAWGVNNADHVVGTTASNRTFLYSNGSMTELPTLAGGTTEPRAISGLDEIVGHSMMETGRYHAFLFAGGRMFDLNSQIPNNPEWELTDATAINDAGQIVGYGTIGGQTHAYLLTPCRPRRPPSTMPTRRAFQVALTVAAPGVLANDYGSGISSMIAGLVTLASHGTVLLHPDGGFTYTPTPGYAGPDAFTYRAINVAGVSNQATVALTVGQPTSLQPPTDLYTYSVAGNVVTLRWTPPLSGARPTAYSVEGGVNPGEVGAVIPTGSAYPIYTFPAPTGAFYVRVRSVAGTERSGPSIEIRLHVGVPVPPSAPASLTAVVNGSSVSLAWRNTFGGGAPSSVVLEAQLGAATWYFPLGRADSFATGGVPAGSYTLRLWATNAGGVSAASNQVTVSFPGACTGPPGPPSVLAYNVGRTIFVIWDPPTTGRQRQPTSFS